MRNIIKSNLIIVIIATVMIFGVTVGYSVLSTELNINANVALRAEKDIRITSVSNYVSVNGAYEVFNNEYTENTFTSNINLSRLDSEISYDILISNIGTSAMEIKGIDLSVFNNDNMTYEITGGGIGTILESNTSLTLHVVFKYKDAISTLPNNTELGSIIEFEFREHVPLREYVVAGSLLDLRGYEAPEGSYWIDTRNNKYMSLNGVVYDNESKLYDFSAIGSYATLGSAIIPATGDFTLEAYIQTQSTFVIGNDEAIVAQVADESNDSGRFKLNFKHVNNKPTLLLFYNSQSPATTTPINFTTSAKTSTNYLMQVVRSGGNIKLYLNNALISTNEYKTVNTISQGPFKIARWNNDSIQQYFGKVYAIRVYNRALTDAELIQNSDVDTINYIAGGIQKGLKNYALEDIVTENDGLYNTSNNTYKYKGVEVNNYIKFLGDEDMYRIISFNSDNTIKLINQTVDISTPFDASGNRIYDEITSSYCTSASAETEVGSGEYKGCNFYGTTNNYNNLTVSEESSAKGIADNWYQNLSPDIKKYVVSHTYNSGLISNSAYYSNVENSAATITNTGYVSLPEVIDVLDASLEPLNRLSTANNLTNYLINVSASNTGYWLVNGITNNTYDEWAVVFGRQLGTKRASRTSQVSNGVTAIFKMKPVIYIRDSVKVVGFGTPTSPYIILEN